MRIILLEIALLTCTLILGACSSMGLLWGSGTSRSGVVKGQYNVQLIECVGNTSSQTVTAVVVITNQGPNSQTYIGGSLDGTLAIDIYGNTYKPYSSSGVLYTLPTGVPVKTPVERIEKIVPGVSMFRMLRVSVGSGMGNYVEFRNIPIIWGD